MSAEQWNAAPAALNVPAFTSTSLGYGTTVMFGFSAGEHERIAAAIAARISIFFHIRCGWFQYFREDRKLLLTFVKMT